MTGVVPYATEAVRVRTVPAATDVAAEPPAVIDREVAVAVCPKTAGACRAPSANRNPARPEAAKLSLAEIFCRTMEDGNFMAHTPKMRCCCDSLLRWAAVILKACLSKAPRI